MQKALLKPFAIVCAYKCLLNLLTHKFLLLISSSLDPETVALMVDVYGLYTHIMGYFIRIGILLCKF